MESGNKMVDDFGPTPTTCHEDRNTCVEPLSLSSLSIQQQQEQQEEEKEKLPQQQQQHQDHEQEQKIQQPILRRKIRIIVITMGGSRKEIINEMFNHPNVKDHFDIAYVDGIYQRKLRNRSDFFHIAYQAGILPENEWNVLREGLLNPLYQQYPERLYECLSTIPINSDPNRKGNQYDIQMHYSVELWKKARTINRGRAILACTFAHLLAMKKLVDEDYDIILEDNIRIPLTSNNNDDELTNPVNECADRIWEFLDTIQEWEENNKNDDEDDYGEKEQTNVKKCCHMKYFGWLGSIPNLRWICHSQIPTKKYKRHVQDKKNDDDVMTMFEYPMTHDIEYDMIHNNYQAQNHYNDEIDKMITTTSSVREHHDDIDDESPSKKKIGEQQQQQNGEREPGGTPIWGTYAYWISKDTYNNVIKTLQNDVGSMLWKSKKMKNYIVKPIDKILPRIITSIYNQKSIQLMTHPAFYRAPMLTSNIHSQWDPEFCKSTTYQLYYSGQLSWLNNIWLTDNEKMIVKYYIEHGIWITLLQLEQINAGTYNPNEKGILVDNRTRGKAIEKS